MVVDEPEMTDAGLNEAVARARRPVAENDTDRDEPDGGVKRWLMDELPLVGEDEPTRAAYVWVWRPAVFAAAVRPEVKRVSVPLSKPPLVMPLPTGAFTVRE